MKHAINELKTRLDILRNNEPIHRAEGRIEQADLSLEKIGDLEDSINLSERYNHQDGTPSTASCSATGPEVNGEYSQSKINPDDDLGELDLSKACRLDNPECESCS